MTLTNISSGIHPSYSPRHLNVHLSENLFHAFLLQVRKITIWNFTADPSFRTGQGFFIYAIGTVKDSNHVSGGRLQTQFQCTEVVSIQLVLGSYVL